MGLAIQAPFFLQEGEVIMQLCSINVVPSDMVAIAMSITTYVNKEDLPETVTIKIALDPDKANGQLDMPVYLPANYLNYRSGSHYELLDLLKKEPFAALEFEQLKICKSKSGRYYGLAQTFRVITRPFELLEEVL
jgi:hypothetical protein